MHHIIRASRQLTPTEISTILTLWQVDEWQHFSTEDFMSKFKGSEFHLLYADDVLVCFARINFDFELQIGEETHSFPELVGLVSAVRMKGYARELLSLMLQDLIRRNVEAIGFCTKELRPFYEKCKVNILYDHAHYIMDQVGEELVASDDDDILDLTLSMEKRTLLDSLGKSNLAYIV